jgi:hypothetical protein
MCKNVPLLLDPVDKVKLLLTQHLVNDNFSAAVDIKGADTNLYFCHCDLEITVTYSHSFQDAFQF